jgi:hypothetical protein
MVAPRCCCFVTKNVSDGTISRQIHETYNLNSATFELNGNRLTASKKCQRCSRLTKTTLITR